MEAEPVLAQGARADPPVPGGGRGAAGEPAEAVWARAAGISTADAAAELRALLAVLSVEAPPERVDPLGGGPITTMRLRLPPAADPAGAGGGCTARDRAARRPALGLRAAPAPLGAHPALLTPPAAAVAADRTVIVRRYAPGALAPRDPARRWLAHAAAMAAACAEVLPQFGAPAPGLRARVAPADRGVVLVAEDDAGAATLADALAAAPPDARDDLLVWAVEALEALHHAGAAARQPIRRRLRAAGDDLWRWQAAARGEELVWHAGRLLAALGVDLPPGDRRRVEEGLLGLAGWAAGLAGTLCHGRCDPGRVALGPGGPRFVNWHEAHWGLPEYDLATLDRAAPLPPDAFDRYCERRGIQRRALFREAFERCRRIADLDALGRALPPAPAVGSAGPALRAGAALARDRLLDDPFTRPLALALG